MTRAFGSIDSVIIFAASCISSIARSSPPATAKSTPFALCIEISRRGELIAAFAASVALLSPDAVPIPINAEPAFSMTLLMSAKSTFMIPGVVIRSDIPSTAWRNMSSHIENADFTVVALSTMASSLSFGIIMRASTCFLNSSRPDSARRLLWAPSKAKGLVTTATVKAPSSFAV